MTQSPSQMPQPEGATPSVDQRRALVEFRLATLIATAGPVQPLRQVDLALRAHQVTFVRLEPGREALPLVDAALGLLPPTAGEVRYDDRSWDAWPPAEQISRRGRCGRVFHGEAWVGNLNLRDNVLLSSRHHTKLPESELAAAAGHWAERFGLREIPYERPSLVSAADRRLCEWVRAFIHKPDLLLLENPTHGVPRRAVPGLLAAISEATTRGTAVLCLTNDTDVWSSRQFPAAQYYAVRDEYLEPAEGPS